MKKYIFDIETNALWRPSKIWVLVLMDAETEKMETFVGDEVEKGVKKLHNNIVIGHNIIKYDIPVLQSFFPWFKPAKMYDTLLMSAFVWNDLRSIDDRFVKLKQLPGRLYGSYSLEAFGYRLGVLKGEYGKKEGAWDSLTPEMIDYCQQDVRVTQALWKKLLTKKERIKTEPLELETKVAQIIARQEDYGFAFDKSRALLYLDQIKKRMQELNTELQRRFPPKVIRTKTKSGKIKEKIVPFNPNSRKMIGERLQELGWKPKIFTATGQPMINETILSQLSQKYEEASLILEYLTLAKRLGQLATGTNAWLKYVEEDGRIHGSVLTMGTVSHRMAHFKPNLAQVPSDSVWWGTELRSLFIAPEGRKLVGIDASSLELRLFAHYLFPFDKGNYARRVVSEDMHQYHADILGISRREAKRFIYAFLYGAGDKLLGQIVGGDKKTGKKLREMFVKNIPGLKKLLYTLRGAQRAGAIKALDGRILHIRKEHAVLNLLIQSAGAIVMKRALVILDETLQKEGLIPREDYEFVNNIHDEWQIEVKPKLAEDIGEAGCEAITKASEYYKLHVKLEGDYKVGQNWAETH